MRVSEGLLRQRVDKGDLLICGDILDSRSGAVVEVFHAAGFDLMLIDREHTSLNSETIADLVRVARCLGFPVMVRVAEDCYHELNRTLDQAPDGIFVPRIKSREQVERLIEMVHYRPLGLRGLAGSAAPIGKYKGWDSVPGQIETVNRNLVVGIQIETAEALDDLDGILSVEGLDMAVVGNDDLSMNMGIPGDLQNPEYIAAVEGVIAVCRRHGVLPGIAVGDPQTAIFWIKKGMKVIWNSCDIYMLYRYSKMELDEIHGAVG